MLLEDFIRQILNRRLFIKTLNILNPYSGMFQISKIILNINIKDIGERGHRSRKWVIL